MACSRKQFTNRQVVVPFAKKKKKTKKIVILLLSMELIFRIFLDLFLFYRASWPGFYNIGNTFCIYMYDFLRILLLGLTQCSLVYLTSTVVSMLQKHQSQQSNHLLQQCKVQSFHKMSVLHITSKKLTLLDSLSSSLSSSVPGKL